MNQIFTHPGQPQMQVEVILASRVKPGYQTPPPIYTIRMRYPRIIHAELMTHRVFGRNARSSRAVPVQRMIDEIRNDPFIPWHWGANQKGMQASEECTELVWITKPGDDGCNDEAPWGREQAWKIAANTAADIAEGFMEAGYHKQIANRLLEPFMWIDVLVTSTDWENFLWLRDHKDAEPHLQDLARLIKQAIANADYQELEFGEWHLPYITEEDWDEIWVGIDQGQFPSTDGTNPVPEYMRKISAARCARISYAPFDGDASYERELERYDSLVSSDRVHASPLEHQATPDLWIVDDGFEDWDYPELHGNLTGWIQNRKLIPNERHYDKPVPGAMT